MNNDKWAAAVAVWGSCMYKVFISMIIIMVIIIIIIIIIIVMIVII